MVKASVIIVNYNNNSETFISKCLDSVSKSKYKSFELIIVENGSKRESIKIIEKYCQKITLLDGLLKPKIIRNSRNLGSAKARNQGADLARGKYLIFLDDDVEIKSDLISEYVLAFEKYPDVGGIHGKSLNAEFRDRFDSAGDFFDGFGLLTNRAGGAKDIGQFDKVTDIASGKACSCAYRRDIFEKVGGFDPDFFFLVEDTDLDMRVWHFGYRVIFLPKAVSWHAFNTRFKNSLNYYSRYLVRYYGARNYILMHLKNLSGGRLLKVLPLHIFALTSMAFLFIITGRFKDGYYMIKGILWNIKNFPYVLKKRNFVQRKLRKAKDSELDFLFVRPRLVMHYLQKTKSYLKSI